MIRSYQEPAYYVTEFTLNPGEEKEIVNTTFELSHYIFDVCVSVDANVLITVKMQFNGATLLHLSGYQRIHYKFTASFPVSTLKVTVKNWSSTVTVNGAYAHHGLYGEEKISPLVYTV